MDEKKTKPEIERYSLDIISAMSERVIKRLWVLIIVLILMLAGTNLAWLWYINQYDFVSYEVSSDGGGNANYIGNDGEIYNNGESVSPETDQEIR